MPTLTLWLLSLLGAGAVAAQPSEESPELPEFEVQGRRVPDAGEGGAPETGFWEVVNVEDRTGATVTAEDLFAAQLGIQPQRFGSPGHFSTLSVRGAETHHTRFLLDGVSIGDPDGAPFNLADLPLGLLEGAEIYRGDAPARLGGSGIGGLVNLRTAQPRGDRLAAQLTVGSYDTYRAQLAGSAVRGGWRFLTAAEGFRTGGRFEYSNDNATPHNAEDDRTSVRANNEAQYQSVLVRAQHRTPDGKGTLEILNNLFSKRQGLAGLGAHPTRYAQLSLLRNRTVLTYSRLAPFSWLEEANAQAALDVRLDRFRDTEGEIGVGRHDTLQRYLSGEGSIYLESVRSLLGWLALRLEAREERLEDEERLREAEAPLHRRTRLGATAEHRWRFRRSLGWSGSVAVVRSANRFEPSEALDRYLPEANREVEITYSPHAGVWIGPTRWLRIAANTGRHHRRPGFTELFGAQGAVTGDPKLKPERATQWDVGVQLEREADGWLLRGEAVYFQSRPRDLITYVQNSQNTSKPQNIGASFLYGVEAKLEVVAGETFDWTTRYVWMETEDRGEVKHWRGNRLPHRPRNRLTSSIGLRWGALAWFARAEHVSRQSLDRSGTRMAPQTTRYDAGMGWRSEALGISIQAEARNVSDDRPVDYIGYPLPGRSYWLELGWEWSFEENEHESIISGE